MRFFKFFVGLYRSCKILNGCETDMGFLGDKWFIHRCLPQSEEIKERQIKSVLSGFYHTPANPTISSLDIVFFYKRDTSSREQN